MAVLLETVKFVGPFKPDGGAQGHLHFFDVHAELDMYVDTGLTAAEEAAQLPQLLWCGCHPIPDVVPPFN
jgi:hypothetical protein